MSREVGIIGDVDSHAGNGHPNTVKFWHSVPMFEDAFTISHGARHGEIFVSSREQLVLFRDNGWWYLHQRSGRDEEFFASPAHEFSGGLSPLGEWKLAGRVVPHYKPSATPSEVQELLQEAARPPRVKALYDAAGLIDGDRNAAYGTPVQNFTNIADLWNVIFRHLLADGRGFEAHHVAQALIQVKAARLVASHDKEDNWVDLAGYAGCGYETTLKETTDER